MQLSLKVFRFPDTPEARPAAGEAPYFLELRVDGRVRALP